MRHRLLFSLSDSLIVLSVLAGAGFGGEKGSEYPDALADVAGSGELAPLFPFRVVHGAPQNITNVQTWDGAWQPAGRDGFVRAAGTTFVNDRGPCRFTGTNICFSGCFPEHDQAEQVAADLARFGINLVRLHYVHHKFPPNKIYASPDSFIEPVQLEKFDYLFNQLKRRGIYVYMQLNIARKFGKAAGFENANKLPWYNNGIDNIEPRMIALQKKYVRDLLTHVNPYTGLAYKDEPAIATLELANENSVVIKWCKKELDDLPSPYQELFQGMWNDWLRKKYGTTADLCRAWGCRADPLGDEMIPDGHFPKAPANAANYPAWGLQGDGLSQGAWEIVADDPSSPPEKKFCRLTIRRLGKTPNMPQFYRRLKVTEGTQYNLSFRLRASAPSQVSVRISQDHDPWQACGLRTTLDATKTWREYAYQFKAIMTDAKVRLVFANFAEGVTVEIADLSFRSGGCIGLEDNETLEARSVPLPKASAPPRLQLPCIFADMSNFLFDCENVYFQQMYRTVKDDVKAVQPVAGTQLGYGFCYPMGRLDYCDNHSYWHHPTGPGGGSWRNPQFPQYWFIKNSPLVNCEPAQSTITHLAIRRIANRPYTVSEYDHAYPNFYAAEGNPMLFALGAFQNWSAIMHFAWAHNDDFDTQAMAGYFDMKTNSVKQVHFPACYAMFARGDVKRGPGKFSYLLSMSEKQERDMNAAAARPNRYYQSSSLLNPDPALAMAVFAGTDLADLDNRPPKAKAISSWKDLPETLGSPERKWIRNEFGELYWNFDAEKGGYFTVDTPNTKLFTGFVRNRSFEFRGLTLRPGKTRLDWTTISLVKTKATSGGTGELGAGSYLLAATGMMHNTQAVLKKVPPDRISAAKGYGGAMGQAPILCEGIPAQLTLKMPAAKVKAFALDQNGDRAKQIAVRGTETEATVEIDPQYQTLWYEIVIE